RVGYGQELLRREDGADPGPPGRRAHVGKAAERGRAVPLQQRQGLRGLLLPPLRLLQRGGGLQLFGQALAAGEAGVRREERADLIKLQLFPDLWVHRPSSFRQRSRESQARSCSSGLVLSTRPASSHALRATATPKGMNSASCWVSCASVLTASITPASAARFASTSPRSSRSGAALISSAFPWRAAASITRSMSTSYAARWPKMRPVGW